MGYTKGLSWLQEKRGKDLIERITWNPTYQVMDAECGTGRITKILAENIRNRGTVQAVDIYSNMINKSKENVAAYEFEIKGKEEQRYKIWLLYISRWPKK